MDSDFIEHLQRVSLTAEEGEVIMVRAKNQEKTLEDCSLSLLGRFHMTNNINFKAMKKLLRSIWKMQMGKDMKIIEVGDKLFQFKFSMESQLKWVMNNGPWTFENHILLLRQWEKGMIAFSVNRDETTLGLGGPWPPSDFEKLTSSMHRPYKNSNF